MSGADVVVSISIVLAQPSQTKAMPAQTITMSMRSQYAMIAQRKADTFAALVELRVPAIVSVEDDEEMPGHPYSSIVAHTTRRADGTPGCILHLIERVAVRDDAAAHEVCHCAQDYAIIDAWGYRSGVPKAVREQSEERAAACAERLIEMRYRR